MQNKDVVHLSVQENEISLQKYNDILMWHYSLFFSVVLRKSYIFPWNKYMPRENNLTLIIQWYAEII